MPAVARAPRTADAAGDRIVKAAGITKGALFDHFADGQALGYAVVDESVEPLLMERWATRLERAGDPLLGMQPAFRTYVEGDIASGGWLHGCPPGNLA